MAHSHEQGLLARMGFADPDRKDRRHTLACQYLALPEVSKKVAQVVGLSTSMQKPDPVVSIIPIPDEIESSSSISDASKLIEENANVGSVLSSSIFDSIKENGPKNRGTWVAKIESAYEVKLTTGRNDFLVGFADLVLTFTMHKYTSYPHSITHKKVKAFNEIRHWNKEGRGFLYTKQYIAALSMVDSITFDWKENRAHGAHGSPYQSCLIEVKVHPVDVSDVIKQMKMYGDFTHKVCATCYQMKPSDKKMLEDSGIKHIYLGDGFKAYCKAHDEERPVQEEGL